MKLLQLNTVYKRSSTGKIVAGIEELCNTVPIEHYVGYRYFDNVNEHDIHEISISTWLDCHVHNRLSTCTGLQGNFSFFHTLNFLNTVERIKPDIIHLHNIHGSYINHRLLFGYIKKTNIPTVWTLHDCWSFTGLCPYFTVNNCEKWKEECGNCIICKSSGMIIDPTKYNLNRKRKLYSNVPNMTIVTPSVWLQKLARESYLKQYPVKVINNGIDLSVFRPCSRDLKKEWGVENKFVVLGVAFDWGYRKGLDVFEELADKLSNDFKIVLVGTNQEINKNISKRILTINRTNDSSELAEIYSSADLFFNPTREDNYPTVNLEALACGTPVLTFNSGGSSEMIDDTCGIVVSDDIGAICETINMIKEKKPFEKDKILVKAKSFDQIKRFQEYVDLYLQMVTKEKKK